MGSSLEPVPQSFFLSRDCLRTIAINRKAIAGLLAPSNSIRQGYRQHSNFIKRPHNNEDKTIIAGGSAWDADNHPKGFKDGQKC